MRCFWEEVTYRGPFDAGINRSRRMKYSVIISSREANENEITNLMRDDDLAYVLDMVVVGHSVVSVYLSRVEGKRFPGGVGVEMLRLIGGGIGHNSSHYSLQNRHTCTSRTRNYSSSTSIRHSSSKRMITVFNGQAYHHAPFGNIQVFVRFRLDANPIVPYG